VRSYRPISNLSVLSKLLERLVTRQLLAHLNSNGLLPRFQSAYRAYHSTETAVLKVFTDILFAVDAGDLSALVLLDLSAAFDTVDHGILLHRLTPPIRPWDQYNNGFNPTCQTGYSTCESDLLPHHSAPRCVVYPRASSLVPYFSFCTAATCS